MVHAIPRSRPLLAAAILAVIAWGLASRKWTGLFPASLGNYPGDALWALMVFLGLAFLMNRSTTARLAVMAWSFAALIETSQLHQAPWLQALRATTLGHLVLGSGFDWLDLCAYTVGVLLGALGDWGLSGRMTGSPAPRHFTRDKA